MRPNTYQARTNFHIKQRQLRSVLYTCALYINKQKGRGHVSNQGSFIMSSHPFSNLLSARVRSFKSCWQSQTSVLMGYIGRQNKSTRQIGRFICLDGIVCALDKPRISSTLRIHLLCTDTLKTSPCSSFHPIDIFHWHNN